MAFEIDERLMPILADTLQEFENVKIINEDILKVRLTGSELRNFFQSELPIKVVANLPYLHHDSDFGCHLIESQFLFQICCDDAARSS